MNGTIQDLNISGLACSLYLPPEYYRGGRKYPVVYMNGGDRLPEIMNGLEPHFDAGCKPFLLVSIQPKNWNSDYTPWPAPALTEKSEDFGGCASIYLSFLENSIKPFIDAHCQTKSEPKNTALIGYSLGGLAALYALYTNTVFGEIGSLSGSLWFDGWTEFMDSNIPLNTNSKVYLSLGKEEEHSRNRRMGKVGDCTRKAVEILARHLSCADNLILEWNNGGHFTEIPQRFQRALLWLMQVEERD